jgi:hypothetical protein
MQVGTCSFAAVSAFAGVEPSIVWGEVGVLRVYQLMRNRSIPNCYFSHVLDTVGSLRDLDKHERTREANVRRGKNVLLQRVVLKSVSFQVSRLGLTHNSFERGTDTILLYSLYVKCLSSFRHLRLDAPFLAYGLHVQFYTSTVRRLLRIAMLFTHHRACLLVAQYARHMDLMDSDLRQCSERLSVIRSFSRSRGDIGAGANTGREVYGVS